MKIAVSIWLVPIHNILSGDLFIGSLQILCVAIFIMLFAVRCLQNLSKV
jgi:hypothetical protein